MPSPQELQHELDRHRGEHDAEEHINYHGEITFLATDKRAGRNKAYADGWNNIATKHQEMINPSES